MKTKAETDGDGKIEDVGEGVETLGDFDEEVGGNTGERTGGESGCGEWPVHGAMGEEGVGHLKLYRISYHRRTLRKEFECTYYQPGPNKKNIC